MRLWSIHKIIHPDAWGIKNIQNSLILTFYFPEKVNSTLTCKLLHRQELSWKQDQEKWISRLKSSFTTASNTSNNCSFSPERPTCRSIVPFSSAPPSSLQILAQRWHPKTDSCIQRWRQDLSCSRDAGGMRRFTASTSLSRDLCWWWVQKLPFSNPSLGSELRWKVLHYQRDYDLFVLFKSFLPPPHTHTMILFLYSFLSVAHILSPPQKL